jgi:hypothetical protein
MRIVIAIVVTTVFFGWDFGYNRGLATRSTIKEVGRVTSLVQAEFREIF